MDGASHTAYNGAAQQQLTADAHVTDARDSTKVAYNDLF
jgi:hypothetical protein